MTFYESAVRYGVILDILDMLPVLDFHSTFIPSNDGLVSNGFVRVMRMYKEATFISFYLPRRCDAPVAGTAEILSGPFWIIRYHTGVSCNLQSIVEVPSCESF
jgi:hypothetical protein